VRLEAAKVRDVAPLRLYISRPYGNKVMHQVEPMAPRALRHVSEHKKLLSRASQVAAIHPSIVRHERDVSAEQLLHKAGFEAHDLVALRLRTAHSAFTLLIVPLRLWYRPLWKRRAIELKGYLCEHGRRSIVVPASYFDHQPRLCNARLIASCANCQPSATDRMAVIAKVIEHNTLSLAEATAVVTAHDPVSVILYMIAERVLTVDPNAAIGPHSPLSVRSS
jgi:hypothetical protein